MIKIEHTEILGWEPAFRGMRNPMNSWDKSDSRVIKNSDGTRLFFKGRRDLELARKLCAGGADDRKFMRMIVVYCDITAPLYWWKEFDTYKVGTVANSCSTMHTLHKKDFELGDFSYENLDSCVKASLGSVVFDLNILRRRYIENDDKADWDQMIQLLPSSFNQKRTVMLNYEVLHNMYHARRNHKLDEWHKFCDWIESLSCSELITGEREKKDQPKYLRTHLDDISFPEFIKEESKEKDSSSKPSESKKEDFRQALNDLNFKNLDHVDSLVENLMKIIYYSTWYMGNDESIGIIIDDKSESIFVCKGSDFNDSDVIYIKRDFNSSDWDLTRIDDEAELKSALYGEY